MPPLNKRWCAAHSLALAEGLLALLDREAGSLAGAERRRTQLFAVLAHNL